MRSGRYRQVKQRSHFQRALDFGVFALQKERATAFGILQKQAALAIQGSDEHHAQEPTYLYSGGHVLIVPYSTSMLPYLRLTLKIQSEVYCYLPEPGIAESCQLMMGRDLSRRYLRSQ